MSLRITYSSNMNGIALGEFGQNRAEASEMGAIGC